MLKNNLLMLIVMTGCLFNIYSQNSTDPGSNLTEITSFDLTSVEDGIKSVNKQFHIIIKRVIQGIFFLIALWQLIEGYMRHQLKDKWLVIVGLSLFIGVIEIFPTLYEKFTGYNPIT